MSSALTTSQVMPSTDEPKSADLTSRVDAVGPCWLWTGTIDRDGYGRVTVNQRQWRAHRYVWTQLVGDIPEGMTLDHLCRERSCVNPDHLEVVTPGENVRRGVGGKVTGAKNAAKTHCYKGHEYTPENTYRQPGTNKRQCKECRRERDRRRPR